ncbi:MAG: hypothetical protein PHF10_03510 [Patescibacteria group bacterium]|nr:hypothetical protein [Patescibacteria group bacterium]MDD5534790.1 hypothetical protein [Patescibacteria group bacterium]
MRISLSKEDFTTLVILALLVILTFLLVWQWQITLLITKGLALPLAIIYGLATWELKVKPLSPRSIFEENYKTEITQNGMVGFWTCLLIFFLAATITDVLGTMGIMTMGDLLETKHKWPWFIAIDVILIVCLFISKRRRDSLPLNSKEKT